MYTALIVTINSILLLKFVANLPRLEYHNKLFNQNYLLCKYFVNYYYFFNL